jgi:hypothetical protein
MLGNASGSPEPLEAGIMNARPFARLTAVSCRYVVLASCLVAGPSWLGLAGTENTAAVPVADAGAATAVAAAQPAEGPQAGADAAATVDPVPPAAADSTASPAKPDASDKAAPPVETASTSPAETLSSETPPGQATTVGEPDRASGESTDTVSSVEIVDECWVVDICVDRYLWALYERAPKEDTIRVPEQRRVTITVTVKKKRKTVTVTKTVTRTFTKLVDENFAWKDQKASEKTGMPMADYVIGGMDRGFKLKLFHILHAADAAGLSPGITSAFRDDYRQSIASGLKAATDRSFHGGSFRGGYGHGLAADVVSVKGATRAERWTSTEVLWKWIDAHAREFGIGRPYLGRDPPHVAPIDGQEYAKHYHGDRPQHAEADVKRPKRVAARDDRSRAKRSKSVASSKVSKIRSARNTPSRGKLHG